MVLTAMLVGLAGALMSLEFSLPMMPPFYKIDFSDVPSIIALFSLGLVSAALVEVIKLIVKVVTVGTNTDRKSFRHCSIYFTNMVCVQEDE
jgi:riboflavin transporter FmnP